MHEAIPVMKTNGKGVIPNVCSVAAQMGIAERFAYSMSRGAIYSMTLSVAKDYLQDNIRCNSISPARVDTPFVDEYSKKLSGKEKKCRCTGKVPTYRQNGNTGGNSESYLYLCSDKASFITGCDIG